MLGRHTKIMLGDINDIVISGMLKPLLTLIMRNDNSFDLMSIFWYSK